MALTSGTTGTSTARSKRGSGPPHQGRLRGGLGLEFRGRAMVAAVEFVNTTVSRELEGADPCDQRAVDRRLMEIKASRHHPIPALDPTPAVSAAVARAAAHELGLPLYRYLGGVEAGRLPVPVVSLVARMLPEGAGDSGFRSYGVIPLGAGSFSRAVGVVLDLHRTVVEVASSKGYPALAASDGQLGLPIEDREEPFRIMASAAEKCGCRLGHDVVFFADVAASEFYEDGRYRIGFEDQVLEGAEFVAFLSVWLNRYPLLSIVDGMAGEDWKGWKLLSDAVGHRAQLVGHDLFASSRERIQRGIQEGVANAASIGTDSGETLSGTVEAWTTAREGGYAVMVSSHTGGTGDALEADLAVAARAGQIRMGSLSRWEGVAGYNRLLEIEEELGEDALYAGNGPLAPFMK